MSFNKDFVTETFFWLRHRKSMIKRTHVCNVEVRIEETLLWKARTIIKENVKISKRKQQQNIKIANNNNIKRGGWTCVVAYWFEKIMMYQLLYFQFEIYGRSLYKFLIGNFTVVLIFFPNWEDEFSKQPAPHRYFLGNWWNWFKNESALGIKYLHRRDFFNWAKIRSENKKPYIS